MFTELRRRRRKAGLPPESLVYTGKKYSEIPQITLISYVPTLIQEKTDIALAPCLAAKIEGGTTWINVDGLANVYLIKQIGSHFGLHPLVMEDILNTGQRSKLESYDNYVFIVLKHISWSEKKKNFSVEQISIILGHDFVLSFQEHASPLFSSIQDTLRKTQGRVREQKCDYLMYVLIDTLVDQNFVVLDHLGDQIEIVEEAITFNPTQKNLHVLYKLKQHVFMFRKATWPVREIINHLLQIKGTLISDFSLPYLRDVYDHSMQIIDTTETFRDIISSMLDMYVSNQTNRINEVMKVLTIIATIFIPLTFVASVYGMNFEYMPELHWRWGYPSVLGLMLVILIFMLVYFRRKKWL
jgi:magnesium transporter